MDAMNGQEVSELFQAQCHLYKHIFYFVSSMSLNCAVELGIPDVIHSHGKPITLKELVSALEIQPAKASSMDQLMRLLAHSGIFSTTKVVVGDQEEEDAFALTFTSRLLLKDNPNCLSTLVLASLKPASISPSHFLPGWFRGNELTAFESAHGMSVWDYCQKNSEFNNIFAQAMASDSRLGNLIIKDCKPFLEGLNTLVDIGGGTGSFARIISEEFPHIKCTVFDLPHVVADCQGSANLNFVRGDMFQSIPQADAFLFKSVFHNYGDEKCLKVLKKCREAIANNANAGKVIIIDIVIDEKKDDHELTELKRLYDVLMMLCFTGRERTEKEWKMLFLEADFSHYKITPVFGMRSIIEVFP